MALTDDELRTRWLTSNGAALVARLRHLLPQGSRDWVRVVADSALPGVGEVPNRKDLRFIDLTGARLNNAHLTEANLTGADFSKAVIDDANLDNVIAPKTSFQQASLRRVSATNADFSSADLSSAHFTQSKLSGSRFDRATMPDVSLQFADLSKTVLISADLTRAVLSDADMQYAVLPGVGLRNAKLLDTNLTGAQLEHSDLEGADLTAATLTNTNLFRARIVGACFKANRFTTDHAPLFDGTDTMVCSRRNRVLNWGRIRLIGTLPLFGISWTAFVLSLGTVNVIGALNRLKALTGLEYTIPFPAGIVLALIGSILSVVGSTAYRLSCPDRVQAFSEAEWVEEHKQPRLLYLLSSWSRKKLQWLAVVPTVVGSGILLYLVWRRALTAAKYLAEAFM